MLPQLLKRMITEPAPRLVWKFAWNFGARSTWTMARFRRRRRRGENFPAVMFISVTTRCNLRCQGCWVSVDGEPKSLGPGQLDRIIAQCKRRGVHFFGILGGEPLLYEGLWDVLGRHGDCYFQVFTNGTLLTDDTARRMRALGNVTPLVSIEGLERTSDERRGGSGVYAGAIEALARCRENRLLTGVATSVCRSNIDELVTRRFVEALIDRGVHYLWYYIYRPVGPNPTPELALSREQILRLRRFMVDARTWAPILIVDAYWDADGRALCPAAQTVSFHVNPWGDIEPCPPIQFAAEAAGNGRDIYTLINDSTFLTDFQRLAAETTPGCILIERPDLLRRFVARPGVRDTSGRGTALDELAAAESRPSQHLPGDEIPERHWMYRFAKRHWYFGFGAYG